MGKRGPKPLSADVLVARGSRHAKKRLLQEAKAAKEIAVMPERRAPHRPPWVSQKAIKVWNELIPILQQMGVLSIADGATIGRYCQSLVEWAELDAAVKKYGPWYTAENGSKRVHPATRLRKEAATILEKCEDRLGLNPSARAGLHLTLAWRPVVPPAPTPSNPKPTADAPASAPALIDGERFFKQP